MSALNVHDPMPAALSPASAEAATAKSRRRLRAGLRWLRRAATVALLVAWILFLRPQFLGGPVSYELVSGTSMVPTLASGDIVVVQKRDRYEIGDVVSFRVPEGDVGAGAHVIHRIVGGSPDAGFAMQGDNRDAVDPWRPKHGDVVGAQWLHVPNGGRVVFFLRSPLFLASLAAALVIGFVLTSRIGEDEETGDDEREAGREPDADAGPDVSLVAGGDGSAERGSAPAPAPRPRGAVGPPQEAAASAKRIGRRTVSSAVAAVTVIGVLVLRARRGR
jgi:signal peptidase I